MPQQTKCQEKATNSIGKLVQHSTRFQSLKLKVKSFITRWKYSKLHKKEIHHLALLINFKKLGSTSLVPWPLLSLAPITIKGCPVHQVQTYKLLGVHVSHDLSKNTLVEQVVTKASTLYCHSTLFLLLITSLRAVIWLSYFLGWSLPLVQILRG